MPLLHGTTNERRAALPLGSAKLGLRRPDRTGLADRYRPWSMQGRDLGSERLAEPSRRTAPGWT